MKMWMLERRPLSLILVAVVVTLHFSGACAQTLFSNLDRPPLGTSPRTVTALLADVDGDGDLDIVMGNTYARNPPGQDRLFLNEGDGTFTEVTSAWMPPEASTSRTQKLAAGDLDGDGDLDLVVGPFPNGLPLTAFLYLNAGGRFVYASPSAFGVTRKQQTHDLVLLDADQDGDLDVLYVHTVDSRLFANDGRAGFTDVTAAYVPALNSHSNISAFAGDIDGDGDPDLLLAGWSAARVPGIFVYVNDGRGHFRDETSVRMSGVTSFGWLAVADIDGDRDLDIYLTDWNLGQHQLFENDGSGRFTEVTAGRLPMAPLPVPGAFFADLDSDGDEDLLATLWDPLKGGVPALYRNDGSGRFTDATAMLPPLVFSTNGPAFGDLDDDGDLDFVLPMFGGGLTFAWWNLSRHVTVDRPPARIGGVLTYDAFSGPWLGNTGHLVLPWLSLGRASTPVVLPRFGAFWLDPATLVNGPTLVLGAGSGSASFTVPVPHDFRLIGRVVYAQAGMLQGPSPSEWRLSGLASVRLRHPRY